MTMAETAMSKVLISALAEHIAFYQLIMRRNEVQKQKKKKKKRRRHRKQQPLLLQNNRIRMEFLQWFGGISAVERSSCCTVLDREFVKLVLTMGISAAKQPNTLRRFQIQTEEEEEKKPQHRHKQHVLPSFTMQPRLRSQDGDLLTIPIPSEHQQSCDRFTSCLLLYNTHESCDTLTLSTDLCADVDLFLRTFDDISFCHFLTNQPNDKANPGWLSKLGYFTLAAYIARRIETVLWGHFAAYRHKISLGNSASNSITRDHFGFAGKIHLVNIWKNSSPSSKNRILIRLLKKMGVYVASTRPNTLNFASFKPIISSLLYLMQFDFINGSTESSEHIFGTGFMKACSQPQMAILKLLWCEYLQYECSGFLGEEFTFDSNNLIEKKTISPILGRNSRKKIRKKRRQQHLKTMTEKNNIRKLKKKVLLELECTLKKRDKDRKVAVQDALNFIVSEVELTSKFTIQSKKKSKKRSKKKRNIKGNLSEKEKDIVLIGASHTNEEIIESLPKICCVCCISTSNEIVETPFPETQDFLSASENNEEIYSFNISSPKLHSPTDESGKNFFSSLDNLSNENVSSTLYNGLSNSKCIPTELPNDYNWYLSSPFNCDNSKSTLRNSAATNEWNFPLWTTPGRNKNTRLLSEYSSRNFSVFEDSTLEDKDEKEGSSFCGDNLFDTESYASVEVMSITAHHEDDEKFKLTSPLHKSCVCTDEGCNDLVESSSNCVNYEGSDRNEVCDNASSSCVGDCEDSFRTSDEKLTNDEDIDVNDHKEACNDSKNQLLEQRCMRLETEISLLKASVEELQSTLLVIRNNYDGGRSNGNHSPPSLGMSSGDASWSYYGATSAPPAVAPMPLVDSIGPFVSVPISLLPPKSKLHWDICEFVARLQFEMNRRMFAKLTAQRLCTSAVHALWPRAQVKPYGSFVTGLSLPSSDVDMVICLPNVRRDAPAAAPGVLEGRNAIKETWQQNLARKLRSEPWVKPESVKTLPHASIPIITLATLPLPNTTTNTALLQYDIRLDISFEGPGHNGLATNDLALSLAHDFPALTSMVLVLKTILIENGLGEAYSGGLSSYALLLLVARFLQEHTGVVNFSTATGSAHGLENVSTAAQHSVAAQSCTDFGTLLLGFLDFYGTKFDPRTTGISVASNCFLNRETSREPPTTSSANTNADLELEQHWQFENTNLASPGSRRRGRNTSEWNSGWTIHGVEQTAVDPHKFDPTFIEDPLRVGNNVGRNCFRIMQIRRAFANILALLTNNSSSVYNCPSSNAGVNPELCYAGGVVLHPENLLRRILTCTYEPSSQGSVAPSSSTTISPLQHLDSRTVTENSHHIVSKQRMSAYTNAHKHQFKDPQVIGDNTNSHQLPQINLPTAPNQAGNELGNEKPRLFYSPQSPVLARNKSNQSRRNTSSNVVGGHKANVRYASAHTFHRPFHTPGQPRRKKCNSISSEDGLYLKASRNSIGNSSRSLSFADVVVGGTAAPINKKLDSNTVAPVNQSQPQSQSQPPPPTPPPLPVHESVQFPENVENDQKNMKEE